VITTLFMGFDPLVPMLGASGAISGVLGGYVLLFPGNKVRVFFFPFIVHLPAIIVLGLWIVFQITSGLGMLGGEETGVAYTAHIGGFLVGLLTVKFFDKGRDYFANRYRQA
jgi:membrane associated rhomboid family serine protease